MKRTHFLLVFALISGWLFGQSFTASVSKSTIGKTEDFQLSFTLLGNGGTNFVPPMGIEKDFVILSGPNSSMESSYINGSYSSKQKISFILRPRSTGEFTIKPAALKVGDETLRSQEINVKVVEKTASSQAQEQIVDGLVKFRITVSKRNIYIGEPINVKYQILYKTDFGGLNFSNEPDLQLFTSEIIDPKGNNRPRVEVINGEEFYVQDIKEMILTPTKSGTIKPGKLMADLQVSIPTNNRDIFGRRIMRAVNATISESFPAIQVTDVPVAGKPQSYSGAVGKYTLKSHLSRTEVKANESITLSIEIEGRGNLRLFQMPEIQFPDVFEVYDPTSDDKITVGSNGPAGIRHLEYLLLPRYKGEYKVPEIEWTYFDTDKKEYVTLRAPERLVHVTEGPEQSTTITPGTTPNVSENTGVDYLNKDILYLESDPGQPQDSRSFFSSWLRWALLILLSLGWLGMIVYTRLPKQLLENQEAKQRRGVEKAVKKALKEAEEALNENKSDHFYAALSKALWTFTGERLGLNPSQYEKDQLTENWQRKGWNQELLIEWTRILNKCEMAQYAPGAKGTESDLLESTRQLLQKLPKA